MKLNPVHIAAFLLFAVATAPSYAASVDYAGWAYTSDSGDFPLRLHVDLEANPPVLAYDLPALKRFDVAAQLVHDGAEFRFDLDAGYAVPWRFVAKLDGDAITGRILVEEVKTGTFEVTKTALPIARIRPDRYSDCAGRYRADDGETLLVTRWQWGELRVVDLESGADRTLFALDDDQFYCGPALYVPMPLESRYTFVRNADDDVVGVDRTTGTETRHYSLAVPKTKDVTWESAGVKLAGTLTFPEGKPPYPAIVVLGGSNWTTRATVSKEAAVFSALGLAVLTYDQRGCGASGGVDLCAFEQTAADARAAVAMLASRTDIDKQRIGLTGTSRGGWTAPLAASKCKEASFVVIKVPPAITPAEQEFTRRMNLFRTEPRSKGDVDLAEQYLNALFVRASSDEAFARFEKVREQVAKNDGWVDVLLGAEKTRADCQWEALNFHYNPIPALEQVHCPILAMFGERDDNVVPAENVPKMKAAFEKGGNRDATIVIVPTANHGLNSVPENGPPLPIHRFTGACPEVNRTIEEWLEKHGIVTNESEKRP